MTRKVEEGEAEARWEDVGEIDRGGRWGIQLISRERAEEACPGGGILDGNMK